MANFKPKPSEIVRHEDLVDQRKNQWRVDIDRRIADQEREHQEWLASPEGKRATFEREVREAEEALAKSKRDAWNKQYQAIVDTRPAAGTVIRGALLTYHVDSEKGATIQGRLIPTIPEYPVLPEWRINNGRYGTRCFLRRGDIPQTDSKYYTFLADVRIIGYSANGKAATIALETK